MQYSNEFLDQCGIMTLPALATPSDCGIVPKLSQVTGVLMLPKCAPGPASWVSESDMNGIIDNSVTDNSKAKYLIVRGAVGRPDETTINQGKRHRKITDRLYALNGEISIATGTNYTFFQKLQSGYKGFNFWWTTLGGRLLGGQKGISPDLVNAWSEYDEEPDAVERAFLQLDWWANGDPLRTNVNINPSGGGGVTPSPIENVMFFHQDFPTQSSAVLTWTTNNGELPMSNTAAQIFVWQNGQKLSEVDQYSIAYATGPGESEVTIAGNTHFPGANYEIWSVITS